MLKSQILFLAFFLYKKVVVLNVPNSNFQILFVLLIKYAKLSYGLLFLLLPSCFNKSANTEALVRDFIREKEKKVKLYQTDLNESYWQYALQVESSDSLQVYCHELMRQQGFKMGLESGIEQLFTDFSDYNFLKGIRASGLIKDQLVNRQLSELLKKYSATKHGHDSIEVYRARLLEYYVSLNRNKDLNWRQNDALFESYISQLRSLRYEVKAYLFSANNFAKELGRETYYDFLLSNNEMSSIKLNELLRQIESVSRSDYKRLKQWADTQMCDSLGLELPQLRLKHYLHLLEQHRYPKAWNTSRTSVGIKGVCADMFREYGFDMDSFIDQYRMTEGLTGGQYKSFILNCDNYYDLRCHCKIPFNDQGMLMCLGDLGFILSAAEVDPSVPYFLREHHPIIKKSISSYFYNLPYVSESARLKLGLPLLQNDLVAGINNPWLLFKIRYLLVLADMERAMYEDPDQDLTSYYWSKVSEYLFINTPLDHQHSEWINNRYLLSLDGRAPLELCSIVLASQYLQASESNADFQFSFSDDFLIYGNAMAWSDLLRRLTGEDLTAEYLHHFYTCSL